ncbi:MAG: hypothetical protein Pg6C_20050 [Treponemataceae bacterium]|nr:MAG: hypothetical protein Pg6C_20050 [Treponemataceae bacterium]
MKNSLLFTLLILPIFPHIACAQEKSVIPSLNYIRITNFSSSTITVESIDDFIGLINKNKTSDVFVTDKLFLIQGQSLLYAISTNEYKRIDDYRAGNNRGFKNGTDYYLAIENNMPDQAEVDYYKQETFLTPADYQDAAKNGFTHYNGEVKKIYGLIDSETLQKNIRYLYAIQYFRQYKNIKSSDYGYQDYLKSLQSTDIDYFIRSNYGYIKRLQFFDMYLIDFPVDKSSSDAVFYYAAKFGQYANINDYKTGSTDFTIKNTDKIYKKYGFENIKNFVDADAAKVPNGNDYNLMFEYGISINQLNQHRQLIDELEAIKKKYLANLDIKDLTMPNQRYVERSKQNFSAAGIGYGGVRWANTKEQCAFAIYNLLKLKKGVPISFESFISAVKNDYPDISAVFGLDKNYIIFVLNTVPQIKGIFVTSEDSFYLK